MRREKVEGRNREREGKLNTEKVRKKRESKKEEGGMVKK